MVVFGAAPPDGCSWTCGGQPLQQVDQFKYLGIHFQAKGGLAGSFSLLKQKAGTAWSLLLQRFRDLQCGVSLPLLLALYQSTVPPTASYGCELWGVRHCKSAARKQRESLARLHVQYLRQICGVRTAEPAEPTAVAA